MLTLVIVTLLALVIFAYLAVPLFVPGQADPLPDLSDPITQDLEEERDALLRAIRELDARSDLATERREKLRARYEAKAAKVLRALDERQATLAGQTPQRPTATPRRAPVAALSLVGLVLLSGSLLGGYVLPRVGEDATLTTADERQLEAGRQLQTLQQTAQRDPSPTNLVALAQGYQQVGEDEQALETYQQVVAQGGAVPAVAYQQLGYLVFQDDIAAATGYLEQARQTDPTDPDTLHPLGEAYFAQGRFEDALLSWQQAARQGADSSEAASGDEQALADDTLETLLPSARAAQQDPNEATLTRLADALWQADERGWAGGVYFEVLMEHNPNSGSALSRLGQALFFDGSNSDAVGLLERAQSVEPDNLETLLFLGNAYFTQERYQEAITVWQDYIEVAGGPEAAGRVPSLIADARERLGDPAATADEGPSDDTADIVDDTADNAAGNDAVVGAAEGVDDTDDSTDTDDSAVLALGERLYTANCAGCHGLDGSGGQGPRLAGNPRAEDANNVRDAVTYGRGIMPGYQGSLSEDELDAVVRYVTETLAPAGE